MFNKNSDNGLIMFVTLLGVGGSGKSRLALAVGRRQMPHFLHGVAFIQLAAVPSSSEAARAICLQLAEAGIIAPLRNDPTAHLMAQLAKRELLLILDNMEHLLEAAPLLDQIMSAAPAVRLLVTSRERLGLQQEQLILLPGLAYPNDDADLAWPQTPAVRLFTATAQRLLPSFEPRHEPAALLTICRLVDGLPLALEMTAAAASQQSCLTVAQRLTQSLESRTSPYRNLLPRQQSMQAVFDDSWQRLTKHEQTLLVQLATFHDPFSEEAAQAVAQLDEKTLSAFVQRA